MRSFTSKQRYEIDKDPFYDRCCLRYESPCKGVIQWHHHLQHGKVTDRNGWEVGVKHNRGGQVNDKFAVLPLCQQHHQQVTDGHQKLTKVCDAIMKERATKDEIEKYGL